MEALKKLKNVLDWILNKKLLPVVGMIFSKKIKEITTPSEQYFISPSIEYIFYLVELDGEIRMNKLNITSKLFKDKKEAKSWRDKISKLIHPDVCPHAKSSEAMMKLNELYQQMTGRE